MKKSFILACKCLSFTSSDFYLSLTLLKDKAFGLLEKMVLSDTNVFAVKGSTQFASQAHSVHSNICYATMVSQYRKVIGFF